MKSEIVVLVPVYQRPHRVRALLGSFQRSLPRHASVVFVVSPEDTEERFEIGGLPHLVMPFRRGPGDWARKINWGYRHTTAPWILCAADDVHFKPGWDTCLRRAMFTGKRVLGTADLNPMANPDGIYSPHPLVARSYADDCGTVDRKNQIFCEDYHHNYPDRELAATAIARDEWLFVADAVIQHLHPAWTDTPTDDTYRIGAKHGQRDYNLYLKRHRLWDRERRRREAREAAIK